MRDIAIVAYNDSILSQETPAVRVECEMDAGLTFTYTTNITIKGVGFVGCGVLQNSTSRDSTADPFIQLYTALYFLYSSYVTLDYINIERTPGTGIVMYATTGRNTTSHSFWCLCIHIKLVSSVCDSTVHLHRSSDCLFDSASIQEKLVQYPRCLHVCQPHCHINTFLVQFSFDNNGVGIVYLGI